MYINHKVDSYTKYLYSNVFPHRSKFPSSVRSFNSFPSTSKSHIYDHIGISQLTIKLCINQELYVQPYESIDWPSCRNNVSTADLFAPHSKVVNGLFSISNFYEKYAPDFLRKPALKKAYELVVMEDENTSYQVSNINFN